MVSLNFSFYGRARAEPQAILKPGPSVTSMRDPGRQVPAALQSFEDTNDAIISQTSSETQAGHSLPDIEKTAGRSSVSQGVAY